MNYTPEQIEEHRKLWTAGLRSGEFRQGVGSLCENGRYCCLGVACEIARRNGVDLDISESSYMATEFDGQCEALPLKVQEWLGLQDEVGIFIINGNQTSLSALNDHAGKSFSQIADFIDSKPEGLFV